MVFDEIFEPFIQESPISVMFRGIMENTFSAKAVDKLFNRTARRQREGDLLFSTCAEMLSLVVAGARKSVNAAYRVKKSKQEIAVSVKSVYDKFAGVEPRVSEALVRETAKKLGAVLGEMKAPMDGPLSGYDVRILDGNHLAATDHRLKELRSSGLSPLPGQVIAVLNPQTQLIEDVVACEDGHANERALLPEVLQRVSAKQCWMGDSNYCTLDFLFGVAERDAFFLIRQHGSLKGELLGRRKKIGRVATGMVYEQELQIRNKSRVKTLRRITIVLDKPTEKGKPEIHILTNLGKRVNAKRIADAYRNRWKIETAFQMLATTLRSEINTLGYPKAALFGFCLGLVLHNVISTLKSAIRISAKPPKSAKQKSAKRKTTKQKLSDYYIADEISGVYRGMSIAIPAIYWQEAFGSLTPKQLAQKLQWLAKRVDVKQFLTNPWSPKPPSTKRTPGTWGGHVATHRLLNQRAAPKNQEVALK